MYFAASNWYYFFSKSTISTFYFQDGTKCFCDTDNCNKNGDELVELGSWGFGAP